MFLRSVYYYFKSLETLKHGREKLQNLQNQNIRHVIKNARRLKKYEDLSEEVETFSDIDPVNRSHLESGELYTEDAKSTCDNRTTNGTRGDQKKVFFSNQSLDWLSAIYLRSLNLMGYNKRDKIAQFPAGGDVDKTIAGSLIMPTSYIDSSLSIDEQIREINEIRPDVLRYYPGQLLSICKKLNRTDRNIEEPNLIITYGENLTQSTKDYIEKTLQAPVRDHYASTEFGTIAWECPEGGYHIAEDSVYAEIITDRQPQRKRDTGELLLTGLTNTATPLIRYFTGDIVELENEECCCETSFKKIDRIRGREKNIFKNAEGEPVLPDELIDILAPVEDFLFFQAIIEEKQYIIRYCPNKDFDPGCIENVREELNERLDIHPVKFEETRSIADKKGKLQPILNRKVDE